MGRVNKTIEGVFIDIVGTSSQMSSFDQFLNQEVLNESDELKELTDTYRKLIEKNRKDLATLASLEEIIMQKRIRENLEDIKFSIVREYIYARTPFYRKDKQSKDVRVIVSQTEFHPGVEDDINILFRNKEFMKKAADKLGQAMDKEINDNISKMTSKKKGFKKVTVS